MNKPSSVLLACAAFALLAGCQKTPEPKTSDAGGAPSVTPSSTSSAGQSVALPPNQVPASDATVAPQAAATTGSSAGSTGTSGSANSPTQANPAALTKDQEKSTLPHSGQVNNHSVPDTTGEKKQ